jgi:predicted dehydrogenase
MKNWPPLAQKGLHPVVDVEDLSMITMQLDNGVLASYEQCHFTPDYWRNYTVIGTEGRLENFGDSAGGTVRIWNQRATYAPDGDASYPITGDSDGHGDADELTMTEFLLFVRDNEATETSPVAARNAVMTAIAATESMRSGAAPREISPVSEELSNYFSAGQHSASQATLHP